MNWDALGAIAELVGATGVIATLLYLGRQIQLSSKAQRAATQHDVLAEFRTSTNQLIDNSGLANAFQQFTRNEKVDDDYRHRLVMHISNVFRTYEELYLAYLDGNVVPALWESRLSTLRDFYLSRDMTRQWWQSFQSNSYFSRPFVELVEQLVEQLDEDV